MEWVEAQGRSVDDAIEAALAELRINRNDATIEVLQEPKAGFLGMGGQDAVVKVTPKPRQKKPRRRRRRKKTSANQGGKAETGSPQSSGNRATSKKKDTGGGSSGRTKSSRTRSSRKKTAKSGNQKAKSSGNGAPAKAPKEGAVTENEKAVTIEEQAEVASQFLSGLLDAFGLEGDVSTRVDDEILFIEINGDQTEALVGAKGAIMQSVLELTRTVIQRKTYGAPRMRIDINGYGERRHEALKIYTGKLVDKVKAEQVEVMLEPMNPADRKVVHDAVAEHDGVRSFSEGEDPHRSVVIALVES